MALSLTLAAAASAFIPALVEGAAIAQTFKAPASCPTCTSDNYVGKVNGTLSKQPVVPGKSFDRFVQIWLENTDFATAASNPAFQKIAAQGQLLTSYNSVTHPSEPNYVASIGGDFFGMADDANYYTPSNISTIVDLLEAKNISWATYQENMPSQAFQGDYPQTNYLNTSSDMPYTYYKRKHNPFVIYNSIANVTSRQTYLRNFNQFAADVNASALPQYVFVTPNMVNDGHDTSIQFLGDWLDYFLSPLLKNKDFNDNRTLILLTFDENENYAAQNNVFSVLLGGALPNSTIGTKDETYYTHYSTLSSVEHNWSLGNLGRQDTNKTVSNVFSVFSDKWNYTNNDLSLSNSAGIPFTNITGVFPGPLNTAYWQPFTAPVETDGAGGGKTFISPLINKEITAASLPAPINVTLSGNPMSVNPNITIASTTASSTVPKSSASAGVAAKTGGAASRIAAPVGGALLTVAVAVLAL